MQMSIEEIKRRAKNSDSPDIVGILAQLNGCSRNIINAIMRGAITDLKDIPNNEIAESYIDNKHAGRFRIITSPEAKGRMFQEHYDQGKNDDQIAMEYHCSAGCVSLWRRRKNLPPHRTARGKGKKQIMSEYQGTDIKTKQTATLTGYVPQPQIHIITPEMVYNDIQHEFDISGPNIKAIIFPEPAAIETPIVAGLRSAQEWRDDRRQEIMDAMIRYCRAKMDIPWQWLQEWMELYNKKEGSEEE